jgi:hypothetical protein
MIDDRGESSSDRLRRGTELRKEEIHDRIKNKRKSDPIEEYETLSLIPIIMTECPNEPEDNEKEWNDQDNHFPTIPNKTEEELIRRIGKFPHRDQEIPIEIKNRSEESLRRAFIINCSSFYSTS